MVAYDKEREWKNSLEEGMTSGIEDASIVGTHMMLEAWELGIASCWFNFFSPTEVKTAFELSENEEIVFLLPIDILPGKLLTFIVLRHIMSADIIK